MTVTLYSDINFWIFEHYEYAASGKENILICNVYVWNSEYFDQTWLPLKFVPKFSHIKFPRYIWDADDAYIEDTNLVALKIRSKVFTY